MEETSRLTFPDPRATTTEVVEVSEEDVAVSTAVVAVTATAAEEAATVKEAEVAVSAAVEASKAVKVEAEEASEEEEVVTKVTTKVATVPNKETEMETATGVKTEENADERKGVPEILFGRGKYFSLRNHFKPET